MSYINSERHPNYPYSSSLSSSASSSTSSIFSLAALASSAASSVVSFNCSDQKGSLDTIQACLNLKGGSRHAHPVPLRPQAPIPAEQRQHPRRSTRLLDGNQQQCVSSDQCTMPSVPPLVREIERKVNFVDNLVDVAAQIVETIWPAYMKSESSGGKGVLPLRTFIQETLRRSRTSYSTLQVALYYLVIIRPHIGNPIPADLTPEVAQQMRALQCGRRMFLAALILASKYLQDRNYSARAWSRISGLQTTEININEIAFLQAVSWRLHISDTNFHRWTELVTLYATRTGLPDIGEVKKQEWGQLVLKLSPDLREALPILEAKRQVETTIQVTTEGCMVQPAEPNCDSFDVRATPRATTVVPAVPIQKVTVSSLLSDDQSVIKNRLSTLDLHSETSTARPLPLTSLANSSSLKAPAVRLATGTTAMACAAAATQMGQLQRCVTDDMNLLSRRSALSRRSSLSTSISSSPESSTYSDSSTNSSPSRFPLSRSSSISSASSIESIIPSKTAAQTLAGKKFSKVPISCNEIILEDESPSTEVLCVTEITQTNSRPNTQNQSPQKNLVFRLKPAAGCPIALYCSRKRQRSGEYESEMEADVAKNTSGITPHLKAQLQVRTPPSGTGYKRVRCGTQEVSTIHSIHGYRDSEEVS